MTTVVAHPPPTLNLCDGPLDPLYSHSRPTPPSPPEPHHALRTPEDPLMWQDGNDYIEGNPSQTLFDTDFTDIDDRIDNMISEADAPAGDGQPAASGNQDAGTERGDSGAQADVFDPMAGINPSVFQTRRQVSTASPEHDKRIPPSADDVGQPEGAVRRTQLPIEGNRETSVNSDRGPNGGNDEMETAFGDGEKDRNDDINLEKEIDNPSDEEEDADGIPPQIIEKAPVRKAQQQATGVAKGHHKKPNSASRKEAQPRVHGVHNTYIEQDAEISEVPIPLGFEGLVSVSVPHCHTAP